MLKKLFFWYVERMMDENTTKVIKEHENITVKDDVFDRFMDVCEKTPQPNQALRDAAAFVQESGIKLADLKASLQK